MTKIRKQRKRKVFRHNVNRKRLRNKLNSTGSIPCKPIANEWDKKKSTQSNLEQMGLSYDPNKTIKIPHSKKQMKLSVESSSDEDVEIAEQVAPSKSHVVDALEADAKAPRVKKFRLPKSQVTWVTYLMDKYGTDYKAMAKDRKNYYQETWKQIRAKIRRFKGIPEQYSVYLREHNLTLEDVVNEDSDVSSDGDL